MKKAYKFIIPCVIAVFFFATAMCCCIGKIAWASLTSQHSCCQGQKNTQQPGPQLKDYAKASCGCPAKTPVIVHNSSAKVKSELAFFSGKSEKMLSPLVTQDAGINLSAVGFSPQYSSSLAFSSPPVYLKNAVFCI